MVVVGFTADEVNVAAQKSRVFVGGTDQLVRFPLTPKDVRVVCGIPDEVQGLESEVVIVAHWADAEPFSIGAVRDLYVSTTRARSLLFVFSNLAEDDLAARSAEAMVAAARGADIEAQEAGDTVA
jgi:hypothetical protein